MFFLNKSIFRISNKTTLFFRNVGKLKCFNPKNRNTETCNNISTFPPTFSNTQSKNLYGAFGPTLIDKNCLTGSSRGMEYTIQQLGYESCAFIDSTKIPLSGEEDGRSESYNSESEITNRIREHFPQVQFLEKGCNRAFGDITPVINGEQIPINVKMVDPTKTKNFNAGGPKTFNYVLYGKGGTTWNTLANKIRNKKPQKCEKSYYYLIYYKNSQKKTIFCSLADISEESIDTNPSNPIQLKTNIVIVERTEQEKVEFILKLFKDCAYKRAKAYLILTNSL